MKLTREHEVQAGLRCPRCECTHHRVVNTRAVKQGIRRRRVCRHCGRTWWSIERNTSSRQS